MVLSGLLSKEEPKEMLSPMPFRPKGSLILFEIFTVIKKLCAEIQRTMIEFDKNTRASHSFCTIYCVKWLRVHGRVMTSHDACTSGTSRVFTITLLQLLKLEILIPAPANCEVRSMIKFLNAQSIVPSEIHRQLCQLSFPADFPLLVAQNCHAAPPFFFRKLCARWVPKQLSACSQHWQ